MSTPEHWWLERVRGDVEHEARQAKAERIARDVTAKFRVTLSQQMILEQVAIAAALAGMEAA